MVPDSADQADDSPTDGEDDPATDGERDVRIRQVVRRGRKRDRVGGQNGDRVGGQNGDRVGGQNRNARETQAPEPAGEIDGDDGSSTADGASPFSLSRRRMMQTAAAAGAGATFTGSASGDEHVTEQFELDGFTEGWVGLAPDDIEGEENPTLELEVGETYVVEWINADGVPHDFVILDADGNELEGTEIMSDEGESLELEFEATEEMAEYYCSVHPAEMRGDIELVDVDPEDPDEIRLVEPGPTIGLETVAENLTAPVDFTQPEGDDRRFVADQPGRIYVIEDDELQDEPFLDIEDRIPELGIENGEGFDERGLLGVAFHPEFEDNGRFFVRYSGYRWTVTPANWSHTFIVSEFQVDDDGQGDPDSERRLMEIPQPQFNHNAGPLEFGPDGYLYIAIGDGGDADDTGPGHPRDWYDENEGGAGQNVTDTMLGGMLRIDVDDEDEGKPYAIPDDNPFAEMDEEEDPDDKAENENDNNGNDENDNNGNDENDNNGNDENDNDVAEDLPKDVPDIEGIAEYWAWGLRNPWGMSFTEDGELLSADVGQLLFEIVNHVRGGGNYGWNVKEGTHCFDTDNPGQPPEECPDEVPEEIGGGEPLVDPVIEYPQEYGVQNLGSAIIGGDIYQGDDIEGLEGAYVFADWSQLFAEPLGRMYVSYPPDEWPDDPDAVPEESLQDQGQDQPFFQEDRWEDIWPMEELEVQADEELLRGEDEQPEREEEIGRLAQYVLAVEPDAEGNLYVLTQEVPEPFGDTGRVLRIVPPDEVNDDDENDENGEENDDNDDEDY